MGCGCGGVRACGVSGCVHSVIPTSKLPHVELSTKCLLVYIFG